MVKRFYDVTVECTGTKTFRIFMDAEEPAVTLGYIGENYDRLEYERELINQREEYELVSIIAGKIEI